MTDGNHTNGGSNQDWKAVLEKQLKKKEARAARYKVIGIIGIVVVILVVFIVVILPGILTEVGQPAKNLSKYDGGEHSPKEFQAIINTVRERYPDRSENTIGLKIYETYYLIAEESKVYSSMLKEPEKPIMSLFELAELIEEAAEEKDMPDNFFQFMEVCKLSVAISFMPLQAALEEKKAEERVEQRKKAKTEATKNLYEEYDRLIAEAKLRAKTEMAIKSKPEEKTKRLPVIKVEGILGGAEPVAMVNESTVKAGDMIAGTRVLEVKESVVKFKHEDTIFELKIGEETAKVSPTPTQEDEAGDYVKAAELIEQLKDPSYSGQKKAIEALVRIKEPIVVSALIVALGQADLKLGGLAKDGLYKMGNLAVQPLIDFLKQEEDPLIRIRALPVLGVRGGTEGVNYLIEYLNTDEDSRVRGCAARELGYVGGDRAIKPLSAVLKRDEKQYVQLEAVEALANLGDQAIPVIVTALNHDNPIIRKEAAKALKAKGEKGEKILLEMTKDKNAAVRKSALKSLGETQNGRSTEALYDALHDTDPGVRRVAIGKLSKVGDKKAIAAILNTLRNDTDEEVRLSAIMNLGDILRKRRVEQVIEPLIKILQEDKNDEIRAYAATALGYTRSPKAAANLIQALKADEDAQVRRNAAGALAHISTPQVIGPLSNALKDQDDGVRSSAALALEIISREKPNLVRNKETISKLIGSLDDQDKHTRFYIVEILGNLKDAQAVKPLLNLLEKEKNLDIHSTALEALLPFVSYGPSDDVIYISPSKYKEQKLGGKITKETDSEVTIKIKTTVGKATITVMKDCIEKIEKR